MTRAHAVIAAYALLALLVVPIYPHFVSPNEFARFLLDASIVDLGTIEVTRIAPLFGDRFEDLSIVDGRAYSNKAPGTNLLSLPGFAIARAFTTSIRALVTAERWMAATLPLILLALLFIRLAKRWNVDENRTAIVVLILLFCTPLFAYGLLLFSHALVAAALFGAWYFLHEERRELLAGALIGIAVAAEYTMAIPAAVLIAPLLREKRVLKVIAGGAPFAIALAAYHTAAFGSPLANPYAFSKLPEYRELATGGFLGIRVPNPLTLLKLLFDPTYGLFVFAPVLALGVMAKRWTLLAAPVAILIIYAGYPYWHGGWNVGPRYLVPVIPFLAAGLLLKTNARIEAVLAGWSVISVTLTTLVFPFVPNAFAFPWMSLSMPLLGSGLVAPNLLHFIARPLAIAVPFAIVVAAMSLFRRQLIYAAIGALLAFSIGVREETNAQRWQRAYIAEVYFGQRGSLGANPPQSLVRRMAAERPLPPPEWPF